ncbi:MAG: hypothetical protein LQ352_005843 [Teloschistes flavicans]|nr:MAG: hypothetical protein LQ352_005843 [Teloschistes flavicans]
MARQVPHNNSYDHWNFPFLGDRPLPLQLTTEQLTAIPFVPNSTSSGRGWQRLGTPTRPLIPGDIYVPDPPTPLPRLLGNDTPTPAETTPGSWKGKRRAGEHVDRPQAIQLIAPSSSSGSNSPERPHSHPEMPLLSDLAHSQSTNTSSYVTADENCRSDHNSSSESLDHGSIPPLNPGRLIQPPQAVRLATHHGQLDGAAEQDVPKHIRGKRSCTEYCKSLKGIPKKINGLFKKEKSGQQIEQAPTGSRKSVAKPKAQGSWANSMKIFKKDRPQGRKPIPSFDGHDSPTRSKQHLLARSSAPKQSSDGSSSADAEAANRFDDPSAPQAFGAPTHEEDLPLSVEPESFLEDRPRRHDPWVVNSEAAQRQAAVVARQAGSSDSQESSSS